jgi:lysylphosphatidylglycerol synthetase-like protein (DUF2156 family)
MNACFTPEQRLSCLEEHGSHCLAYSTLQPGLDYFDVPGMGYIAYVRCFGTHFVLSDPICSSIQLPDIIQAFLRHAPGAFFVQIHGEAAGLLQRNHGFLVNSFGVENVVDPHDFRISWNVRRDLKRWLSALGKRNIVVYDGQSCVEPAEISRVSEEWLATKTVKREMAFLAKPFCLPQEPRTRRFFSSMNGRLVAFCTFDPCYCGRSLRGYALNHMRAASDAPNGVIDYTIVNAIRAFGTAGIHKVHLGVSPLHDRDKTRFRGAGLTDLILDFLYRRCSKLYRFRELGFHKDRYCPEKEQVYFASRKRFMLFDILRLLRVNRVL